MRLSLQTLAQDASYALRSFRRSPAFFAVALLSLTLGIGATTAIFSVIYGVLIRPYPYARPDEIWAPQVRAVTGRGGHGYSVDEFQQMKHLPAFSDVMATGFESLMCLAAKTAPIPPWPRSRSRTYLPAIMSPGRGSRVEAGAATLISGRE